MLNAVKKKWHIPTRWAEMGQVENADFSDIADFISPTFINPCFRYSPIANIETLDLKNPRFSNIRVFDIHLYGEYRKHGCLKISDFFKSQFLIFY